MRKREGIRMEKINNKKLTEIIDKFKKEYSFINLPENKFLELLNNATESCLENYQKTSQMDYYDFLNYVFEKEIWNYIKEQVQGREKNYNIMNQFLQTKEKKSNEKEEDLCLLKRFQSFLQKIDFFINMQSSMELIQNCSYLSDALEKIVQKNLNDVENGNFKKITNDETICTLLKAFWELYNIKIEESYSIEKIISCDKNNVAQDILKQALPKLEKDETKVLVEQYLMGDNAAGERLIRSHLLLIAKMAHRYETYNHPFEDLLQAGCIGFVKALPTYDVQSEVALSTYAHYQIGQEIRREIRENSRDIKLPRRFYEKQVAYKNAKLKIQKRTGTKANVSEIAKELGVTQDIAKLLLFPLQDTISLNCSYGHGESKLRSGEETELGDYLPDSKVCVEDKVVTTMLQQEVQKLIQSCNIKPRDREIFNSLFGLNQQPKKSGRKIAQEYGLSKTRVYQIQDDVLEKLSQLEEIKYFADYMDYPDRAREKVASHNSALTKKKLKR